MNKSYNIEEILSAVNEIINTKKEKKIFNTKKKTNKDYSSLPKKTIKLIEEAEKHKVESSD
tara:strand:+ start:168 stop:350 length:183 start_codon:yes stop_codon:yes gene_type:complete